MTEYRFDPSDTRVVAGAVTLTLVNAGSTTPDMVVADSGAT
jgi:hypothetical protein